MSHSATNEIGQRIATLRKRRNMSQAALASAAGASKEMVCRYERGRVQPRVDTLTRIATVLGVTLDALA